jgi:hypothetical protein
MEKITSVQLLHGQEFYGDWIQVKYANKRLYFSTILGQE